MFKSSFFSGLKNLTKMYRKEKVDPMSQGNYFIITNNPLVLEKLGETHNVIYQRFPMKRFLRKSETESTKGTCFYHIPYPEV